MRTPLSIEFVTSVLANLSNSLPYRSGVKPHLILCVRSHEGPPLFYGATKDGPFDPEVGNPDDYGAASANIPFSCLAGGTEVHLLYAAALRDVWGDHYDEVIRTRCLIFLKMESLIRYTCTCTQAVWVRLPCIPVIRARHSIFLGPPRFSRRCTPRFSL